MRAVEPRQFAVVRGEVANMSKEKHAEVPSDLREVMRANYDELIEFVLGEEFLKTVEEMYSLPKIKRAGFVKTVILDPKKLQERGVKVPDGVLIQRSSFGDKRPTLFVVKKYLPKAYQVAWENVNITFDQDLESKGERNNEQDWSVPLPMEVQAAMSAMGLTQDDIIEMRASQ